MSLVDNVFQIFIVSVRGISLKVMLDLELKFKDYRNENYHLNIMI